MRTKNPIALLIGWLALALTPDHIADAAETPNVAVQDMAAGNISGVVSSTATGKTLQGAVVEIPALDRRTLTDSSGRFLLSRLPFGPMEIVISYLGLKEARQIVMATSESQRPYTFELTSDDILMLEKFTVASEREGNALAVASQLNAPNLKNTIAMDAFGNMPNMGVGELAMRLPGAATVSYDDEGNAASPSVRGMPRIFGTTTIDGSPLFRGNGARLTSYVGMTGAIFETIELTKGHTPDQTPNSLGGGINLKTRSPLSMTEKRRITYNVGARWAPSFLEHGHERLQHPIHPLLNFSYQEAFNVFGGERNLGVLVALFYSENVNAGTSEFYGYQNTEATPAFIYNYRAQSQINNRHISTANVKVEYRKSEATKYSLGFIYNHGSEPYQHLSRIDFLSNQTVAALGPDGNPTGPGAILPGFTKNRTEVRAVPGSNLNLQTNRLSFYSMSPSVNFVAEHKLDRWEIDYKLAHTSIHIDRGHGKEGEGGMLTMQVPAIGWIIDNTSPSSPRITQTAGASIYDPASYGSLRHSNLDEIERSRAHNADFNAAYRFDRPINLTLKGGAAFERRENDRISRNSRQWDRVPGAPPLPNQPIMVTPFDERQGGRMPIGDPLATSMELSNPALWREDLYYNEAQRLSQTKYFTEQILAGYAMFQGRQGKFGFLGGVRVEDTEVKTRGNHRRMPATAAQIPDPVARARYDWGNPINNEGGYTRSFPSVHLNYHLTKDLKARASWSTSFGRPNPNDLTPNATINNNAQTVTIANPGLGPQFSTNIDLSAEYYIRPAGLLAFGYFTKSIEDYILTTLVGTVPSGPDNGFSGDNVGYELFTRTNAGTAKVHGWEVDYRQQLTFLPGALKGLEIAGNYTRLSAEGNFGTTETRTTSDVPEFVPQVLNLSVAYNYQRFGSRVTYNYTDGFLLTYNPTRALRFYASELETVILNLSYRLRPEGKLSLDVTNVLGERRSRYQYEPSRIRQIFVPNTTVSFGVSGSF